MLHCKEFLHTQTHSKKGYTLATVYQETDQRSHSSNLISLPNHWNQSPSLLTKCITRVLGNPPYWVLDATYSMYTHSRGGGYTHVYTCYHSYDTNYLTQKQTKLSYIWLQNHMSCDALIRVESSDTKQALNRARHLTEAPQEHNALRKA